MTEFVRKTVKIMGGGETVHRYYCRFFRDFRRDWR